MNDREKDSEIPGTTFRIWTGFKYLRALYHGSRETTKPFIVIIHQE